MTEKSLGDQLAEAAWHGHTEEIARLLEAGAPIDHVRVRFRRDPKNSNQICLHSIFLLFRSIVYQCVFTRANGRTLRR